MNMEKSRGEGEGVLAFGHGSRMRVCVRLTDAFTCAIIERDRWVGIECLENYGTLVGQNFEFRGEVFFLVSLGGSTGSGKGKCEGNHRHFAILDYLHVCCVVCNGIIVAIVAIRRGARLCFRVTQ